MPEFYIFARKVNKISEFYMIFAQKIIFPDFLVGASALPCPLSYAYVYDSRL